MSIAYSIMGQSAFEDVGQIRFTYLHHYNLFRKHIPGDLVKLDVVTCACNYVGVHFYLISQREGSLVIFISLFLLWKIINYGIMT